MKSEVSSSAASFWSRSYFAPLDGLRAISVLLVVAYHIAPANGATLSLQPFVQGHLAVDIFFVLSGFLITTLLLREEREYGSISLKSFYIRRFFRIVPVYVLAVVAYLVIGLLPSQHEILDRTIAGLPYFISFRNEYIPETLDTTLGHTWSLSVEEKFYFLWPLIFFVLLPKLRMRWLAVALVLPLYVLVPEYLLFTSYISLLLGCAVAVAMEAGRSRQEKVTAVVRRIPPWAMLAFCLVCYYISLRYYRDLKLVFSVALALLIPYLLLRPSFLSKFLGSSVLVWIGKRTYAMYLLHRIGSNFTENYLVEPVSNATYLAAIFIAYGLAIVAAQVTYVLVERPLVEVGRKLSKSVSQSHLRTRVTDSA